jgi:hypothetical protein
MAATARLKVEIIGDARSAVAATGQAEAGFKKMGGEINKVGRMVVSAFAGFAALQFARNSITAANDMAESWNKFGVVFGDTAKDVRRSLMGLTADMFGSTRAAVDAAGTFGNMFKQMGFAAPEVATFSKGMLNLARDLVSFHNADPTEVIQAVGSAFRGEFDSVQKWIPTITAAAVEQQALADTGKESAEALTAGEKAAATYTIMLRGLGDAQGDAAATAGSASNKQRALNRDMEDASITIGQALQPAMAVLLPMVAELATAFADASPQIQNATIALAGFTAVALVIGGTLGGIIVAIGAVVVAIVLFQQKWGAIWAWIENLPAYTIVAAALVALMAPIFGLIGVARLLERHWADIWQAITGAVQAAVNTITGYIDMWIGAITAAFETLKGAFTTVIDFIKGAWNAFARFWNRIEIRVPGIELPGPIPDIPGFTIGLPNLPTLAQGGIVTRPTLALIGERGPEAVVPLGARGVGTTINVTIMHTGLGVDSPRLQRDVVNAIRGYVTRNGPVTGVTG